MATTTDDDDIIFNKSGVDHDEKEDWYQLVDNITIQPHIYAYTFLYINTLALRMQI